MNINKEGVDFIMTEESGGKVYYEEVIKKTFEWPGGASGCTAMGGVDIGYYTEDEINAIFKNLTTDNELKLIQAGRGITGSRAQSYLPKLKGITFEWDEATHIFESYILPKFENLTARTFPGVEELCDNAQSALVSLVFNRGTALSGERRREMAAIRQLIPKKDYEGIAGQLRAMKRLWGRGNGLIGRREREAKLVESCATS